jgi:hypothetical protein
MKLIKSKLPSLTKEFIESGKADAIFFDDEVSGFGVRLRAGGKRTWIIQFRAGGKQRRMVLGTLPSSMPTWPARSRVNASPR